MKTFSYVTSLIVGSTVLAGWYFDWNVAKSILAGKVSMKVITAHSFVLLGLAGLLHKSKNLLTQVVTQSCSVAVMLSAWLMGVAYILNPNAQLLPAFMYIDDGLPSETLSAGVPAATTLINFFVLGFMGTLRGLKGTTIGKANHLSTLAVLTVGLLALLGYVINIPILYGYIENKSTAMALHTAGLFVLLGLAELRSREDRIKL